MNPDYRNKLNRIVSIIAILLLSQIENSFAQIDTQFWFAAPGVDAATNFYDRPIVIRLTSFAAPANITISMPANPGFNPININLAANSSTTVDLTLWIDQIENSQPNLIVNKGILVSSTAKITAYYEVVSGYCNCNPEIFALKGANALGSDFYIITQNVYDVDTVRHPNANTSFDIVATEDNTVITITPSHDIIGHPAGVPFQIILNRGQTYSAVAKYRDHLHHLGGSIVKSSKPIAITIKEDLIFGDGSCADLAGDQTVPISVLGLEYILVKGYLNPADRLFLLATEDNTAIYIDGNTTAATILSRGQTWSYSFSNASIHIRATHPVYAYQITGNGCEVGSAIIPKLNCTGSNSVSITRSSGETFAVMIYTKAGNQNSFTVNGNSSIITAANFSYVPGTGNQFVAARVDLSSYATLNAPVNIANNSGKFGLGFINGASVGGCRYGFFSDFKSSTAEALLTSICQGDSVQLNAKGGIQYRWSPIKGLSDPNIANPKASPDSSTTYTAYITDETGCVDSAIVEVKITKCVLELCNHTLGDPILHIDFGSGDNPGKELSRIEPNSYTSLNYVSPSGNPAAPLPKNGEYCISNSIPQNANWFTGFGDHTGNTKGFMAIYNSMDVPGTEYFSKTVSNLCGSGTYEFSAWVANCINPASLAGTPPNLTFQVELEDGTVVSSYSTGPIAQNASFEWRKYGVTFKMPITSNNVKLRIFNNYTGLPLQEGTDFALDDINLSPCAPGASTSFDNSLQVDSLTTCRGEEVKLFGKIESGYLQPAMVWQYSNDKGISWHDIANSNSPNLTVKDPFEGDTDTLYYRMQVAESALINSAICRMSSNVIYLIENSLPNGAIYGAEICQGAIPSIEFSSSADQYPLSITISYANETLDFNSYRSDTSFTPTMGLYDPAQFKLMAIKDGRGCFRDHDFLQDTAMFSVRKSNFISPRDTSTCMGSPVKLMGNNGAETNYLWSPATGLNDPTAQNPIVNIQSSTEYSLTVRENRCQFDSTFKVYVTVHSLPDVQALSSNDIDCSNFTAQLTALGATAYNWHPASGLDNPGSSHPIADIDSTTIFTVIGTDENGCSNEDTVLVKVSGGGKVNFALPNAFTPNGDGHNDCFGIRRWGNVQLYEFSIYNRWGQRIFTTTNPSQCWDGTFQGQIQDPGGYAYVIRGLSKCGSIRRTGIVMLVR
jgi:gliding motility-associated-like protein